MTRKRHRPPAVAERPARSPRHAPVAAPRTERFSDDEHVSPYWRWRSFPVFFAFVTGMLAAFLANGATSNPVAFVLLIGALLGFGYCVAHLVVTNIVVAGRVRRRRASIARGEVQEEDYVDELVYPDEARAGAKAEPRV